MPLGQEQMARYQKRMTSSNQNRAIMLALCSMLSRTYYASYCARIISSGLLCTLVLLGAERHSYAHAQYIHNASVYYVAMCIACI